MLITTEDHINHLHKLINDKPKNVYIATFNIYAGILFDGDDVNNWGDKYKNEVHGVLDHLQESGANTKILVGIPGLIVCKSGCEDCLTKHLKVLTRLQKHAEKWPFDWRYTEEFHLKSYIFDYGKKLSGVVGGRNLSPSNWVDLTFKIGADRCRVIKHIFNKEWEKAKEITGENMEVTILEHMDYLNND